jgi:hypothetical protein
VIFSTTADTCLVDWWREGGVGIRGHVCPCEIRLLETFPTFFINFCSLLLRQRGETAFHFGLPKSYPKQPKSAPTRSPCSSQSHTHRRASLPHPESRDGHDDDHAFGGAHRRRVFRAPRRVQRVRGARYPASGRRDPRRSARGLRRSCGGDRCGRTDHHGWEGVQAPRTHRRDQGACREPVGSWRVTATPFAFAKGSS